MTSHLRCKSAPETAIFNPARLLLVEGTATKSSALEVEKEKREMRNFRTSKYMASVYRS
jgi:hypothetical protein